MPWTANVNRNELKRGVGERQGNRLAHSKECKPRGNATWCGGSLVRDVLVNKFAHGVVVRFPFVAKKCWG